MESLRSVCVYCGASTRVNAIHKEAARRLGTILGGRGIELIYGGGRVGLMGILADAALAAGGRVTGVIPEHIQSLEVGHTGLTNLIVVETMHERKRAMIDRANAFVVLPGGFGTLDETFEILSWKQLRLHDKPMVLVDIDGYWGPLVALIDHVVDQGFAQPGNRRMFTVVSQVEDVIDALARQPAPAVRLESKWL
ncbi:Cytokinin riboside 5'-monophosphate phosphoribohydrolase [uncultured Gammaproteobacteria bacterium]